MVLSRRRFLKWTALTVAVTAVATTSFAGAKVLTEGSGRPAQTETETATVTATSTATKTTTATETSTATIVESTSSTPGPMPPTSFSIFWITDTQFLSESNPALFRMMVNWIVENWGSYNGRLVVHTGDVVQTGDLEAEWVNAGEAMSILLENGIPYTWCAGNHDDLVGDDPSSGWSGSKWAAAFDPSSIASQVDALKYVQWAGDFHDGMNTAVSFSASGLDFLVVNIEWNAGPDVLEWVGSLLDDPAYEGHHVIVAPHAYIDSGGSIDDPRWGSELADFIDGLTSLMDAHSPNIFLTLNGHFASDQGYDTPSPVSDRNELMFDRQDCTDASGAPSGRGVDDSSSTVLDADKVGGATVTILTFDTKMNQISVKTYDVYTGKWREDPDEQYQFDTFPVALA